MLHILLTTGLCNLRCDYCGGSFLVDRVPHMVKYGLKDLFTFLSEDSDATIAFYGGEPLLNSDFIRHILDKIDAKKYVIQTNGLLVKVLEPLYWKRFDTVLLSIDGIEGVNDRHRGGDVYKKVIRAAKWLRRLGFEGDIVARMAVTEDVDIYRDVTHLLSLNLFDHIHWQLDVIWSDRWRDFTVWAEHSYKIGISKLVRLWVKELKNGMVLGIAPIQGVLARILFGGSNPPCGSGQESIAISTDGRVLACPIAFNEKWAELGHISYSRVRKLRKISIGTPCTSCSEYGVCGGRCLYTHKERFWGEEGFRSVCDITLHMIKEIRNKFPKIEAARANLGLGWKDLIYPPFNNTVEIIP